MADFEVHPVGTARRIAELEQRLNVREFTDEEKSDMYWESNTAEGIAPDEDLPVMLKKQCD